jgi:type I restriction enzyme, S subunit
MNELTFAPLANFADITMGQSPGSESCNTDNIGLPFLQGCAEFGRRNPETDIYCSPPLRIGRAKATLISVRAPVGTMNYADRDYCIGRGLAAFKSKPGVANNIFLKHAVEQGLSFLHRRSQGSTFAAVSSNDIRSLPIPNFSVSRQNEIASILTSIDTAIERTEALIAKYQQIKAGLMHDLFTRGVLPNGQLRPPREQAPELYQETVIGWIPREWDIQSVETALESVADGPFGSNLKTEHYVVDAGVEVVRLQNVAAYEYDGSDKAYVSNRHAVSLARNKVVAGDVLIAGLGDDRYAVGRACCYPADAPPAINKADCFRARCDPNLMTNKFCMLFLNSELARRQMRRFEQGVTRPRINTGNLKRVIACIPGLAEQNSIISKFEAAQKAIQTQVSNADVLRKQKLGLMQDLLTGKVTVKADTEASETVDG